MTLAIPAPLPPMEALAVSAVPEGDEWQYEPKWDGFRCLAFREATHVELWSKSGQPLSRYFPELLVALLALPLKQFALDGEIVIPKGSRLSFDDLLMRIHPAESRIRKLAVSTPALYIVFDLLADDRGKSLLKRPLEERREKLEAFAAKYFKAQTPIRLSPVATDVRQARRWFKSAGSALDGIVAKRRDLEYRSGDRTGMQKIKPVNTADCVVAGFRLATKGGLGSLLLGLYDDQGLLNLVGFTSGFKAAERKALLKTLVQPPGFTGKAPGRPSRWSTARSTEWQPLVTKLVVEVEYDHFTSGRFRHSTTLVRWRPDKATRQCTMDQVTQRGSGSLKLLRRDETKTTARVRP